jgi:hypothetical protein
MTEEFITLKKDDLKIMLETLSYLVVIEYNLEYLEYTGDFEARGQSECMQLIDTMREIITKKLVYIDDRLKFPNC